MFNLERESIYTWSDIFIVLSWEGYFPYLAALDFPILDDIKPIQQVAQKFIERFHEIAEPYSYSGVNDDTQQVFDSTYQALLRIMGEAKTEALCKWGNQMHFDPPIAYSLGLIIRILIQVSNNGNLDSIEAITLLSNTSRKYVQSLLKTYLEESRNLSNSLDIVDEQASNNIWLKEILQKYGSTDQPNTQQSSPTNQLAYWLSYIRERSLVNTLKQSMSLAELKNLNDLLKTRPDWVRAKSNVSPIHYKVLDLIELLDAI